MTATSSTRFNGIRFPDGTNAPSGVFNLKDPAYGVIPDGVTDNTVGIQAAYTAAAAKGGTVYWPSSNGERYTLTSMITVSSIYPVNSIGDMHGYCDNQTTGAFIRPGANFGTNPMIRYVAPGGSHTAHGAGKISGLSFYDNTNTNHTPNYTMLCALDLFDFNLGRLESCFFHVLNGGAIRTTFMVQASIHNVEIRYCGTASQPALSVESTSTNVNTQSTSITESRLEVCYGKYLSLDSRANEVKIDNVGFESDSTSASAYPFIDNSGQHTFISNVHMNRNIATQLVLEAASNFAVLENIIVLDDTSKTSNPSVSITGSNHSITNLSISGAIDQTTAALQITNGAYYTLDNIQITNAGGIDVNNNSYLELSNAIVANMVGGGTYAVDVHGGSIHETLSCIDVISPAVNIGGIRITGAAGNTEVLGCFVTGVTGTGVAFRDENSNNVTTWLGCRSKNNATDFTASATAYVARGNTFGGVETETIQGVANFIGGVNGFRMVNGQVIDCNATLNLGVTTSNGVSIAKTGTTMTINGATRSVQGFASGFRSAATPVTLAKTDYTVGVSGSGARAVTLPAASTCMVGQQFVVQDIGGSTGVITITRAGSDTINGGTSVAMSATAYARQILICDGVSSWFADSTTI